jgi:hypothetical protein
MSARAALRAALVDGYHHSWRLLLLNAGLSTITLGALVAASYAQPALALLLLVGPGAATLMHCAVRLSQTGELRLRDAADGLRRHWRRGLALGAVAAAVFGLGALAVVVYAESGRAAWPLALLTIYLLAVAAALQLVLWPLALARPQSPLWTVALDALREALRRPLSLAGLAAALLVVNVAGAVAILPLLTLTIAYSFLAAAHFVLPRSPTQEA